MLERITEHTCPGRANSSIIATINNGDSFRVSLHFYNEMSPYAPFDLNLFDLVAEFYILGYEDKVIRFEKSSISDGSVIIDPYKSMIKFLFNDYELNGGKLFVNYKFTLPDPEIPGQTIDESIREFTGIMLR